MRGMLILFTILLVTPALAFSQSETPSATQNSYRQSMFERSNSTLTGCLTGKPDGYQVMDQSGTRHLIMNPNVNLSSYVGHKVELTGTNDARRDAAASSDEGTAYGMEFFKVIQVDKDLGSCK
jgi:hypothetical protein